MRDWLRSHQVKHLPFRESTDDRAMDLLRRDRFEPRDDKPLDLLHAALALDYKAALATLNRPHFEHVEGLLLLADF